MFVRLNGLNMSGEKKKSCSNSNYKNDKDLIKFVSLPKLFGNPPLAASVNSGVVFIMTDYTTGKDIAFLEVRVQRLEATVQELLSIIKADDEKTK